MNEIKIDGKLCNKKESFTPSGKCITTFGLNFYNGKKDGKSVYDFIDCKMFDKINFNSKERVSITGWLGVESWTKDGKTNKKVVVYVKEITGDITKGMVKPNLSQEVSWDEETGDGIPF